MFQQPLGHGCGPTPSCQQRSEWRHCEWFRCPHTAALLSRPRVSANADLDGRRHRSADPSPALATRRKRSQNAKQFHRFAIRQRLASVNPFADLKSAAVGNDKRLYFVTLADLTQVMDEATDSEWRLIPALAGFGGLRVSEIFGLEWTSVDWSKGTILIHSSKNREARHRHPAHTDLR